MKRRALKHHETQDFEELPKRYVSALARVTGLCDYNKYDFIIIHSYNSTSFSFHMFCNLVQSGAAYHVELNAKHLQPLLGKERQRSDLWWRQTAANAFGLHCFTCPV